MLENAKKFAKEHKKEIIIGTLTVAGAIAVGFICRSVVKDARAYKKSIARLSETVVEKLVKPKWDPGRDCVMRFFVEGTEEFLGEVQCAEAFVRNMLDCCASEAF